jgi:hypothetical protein
VLADVRKKKIYLREGGNAENKTPPFLVCITPLKERGKKRRVDL